MILSSPRFTCGISSGRSRNHGQNAPHQKSPSAAISRKGIGQLPQARNSHINTNGIKAPPHRLNIQIEPCAFPRSVMGIQSAMTLPIVGNPPAWNMPKRKRSTSK